MNVFRLTGDLSHLLAIIILLLKIWKTRSCAGISGKSQILFAVVYTSRYLDLVTTYISAYNSVMKIVFIAASYATIYLMYLKFKATYDHNHDTFRIEFLLIPAAALALLINHDFTVLEVLWTFSIYLESVAILPQLFLVSKTGEAESITSHYLFALGSYRALYLLNWVYRYMVESHYDLIAIVAGAVQTVLYCDFFYLYITKVACRSKGNVPEGSDCFFYGPTLFWNPCLFYLLQKCEKKFMNNESENEKANDQEKSLRDNSNVLVDESENEKANDKKKCFKDNNIALVFKSENLKNNNVFIIPDEIKKESA